MAHIEANGSEGLIDAYKRITEDDADNKRWLINVAQAARTPQDKKSGQSLKNYVRRLYQAVDGLIPWKKSMKTERLKGLKKKGPTGDEALKESEAFANKLGL